MATSPAMQALEAQMTQYPALYSNPGAAPSYSQQAPGTVRNGVYDGDIRSHESLQGFEQRVREFDGVKGRRTRAAAKLYTDVLHGKEHPMLIQEALSPRHEYAVNYIAQRYPGIYGDTGRYLGLRETMALDYQALTADVLDRTYYGFYNSYPIVNMPLVKKHLLRDWRQRKIYMLDGAVTPLTYRDPSEPPQQKALQGPVPQGGSVLATASTAAITYQPLLGQSETSVNWAALYNDDLGIFQDLGNRLAIQGNRGISKFITSLYVDANGPHANLYKSGYGNQILQSNGAAADNPVLGFAGLEDALKILTGMKDSGGDPILVTGRLRLWFGPALIATANNLMNQISVFLTTDGGGAGTAQPAQFLQVNNWLVQNMDLIMDPYIPIVCTTSGVKNTMWGITVDPNSQARPSIEFGTLPDFDPPAMFTKVPNTARVGGGVDVRMGDFSSGNQEMKIISVAGGVPVDGRTTVSSTGSTHS